MTPQAQARFESLRLQTRRYFLGHGGAALGAVALSTLTGLPSAAASSPTPEPSAGETRGSGANSGRAKRIIYLHMAGSPPAQELFDFKPELERLDRQPCPDSFLQDREFPFIKGHPKMLGPVHPFQRFGESGLQLGSLMPQTFSHADSMCVVRSMTTTQFNHAPAQLLLHTGNAQFGGGSMGSWVTYGLGSENENLPGFIVLVSGGKIPSGGKSLWNSSFLPSVFQGVQCRSQGDPVLFVSDPDGMRRPTRRAALDALADLNRIEHESVGDPETLTRIEQYELAFRMQTAVPEVMDISRETRTTLDAYGAVPGSASFANNCLLARRLITQGVRFVQLYDWGWDVHGTAKHDDLVHQLPKKCEETDRPIAALLTDLKQMGLLDETLVVFGGEFGRTPMIEDRNGKSFLGRDHHPDCFSLWVAGGGFRGGYAHGATDPLGFTVSEHPVTVRDFQATLLHAMSLDPHGLSFPFQGLNQRLIGPANTPQVVPELLAG